MSDKKKKIILAVLIVGLLFAPAGFLSAQETYPKLANYYLKYFNENEHKTLTRCYLLILPPEMIFYNKDFFDKFR